MKPLQCFTFREAILRSTFLFSVRAFELATKILQKKKNKKKHQSCEMPNLNPYSSASLTLRNT